MENLSVGIVGCGWLGKALTIELIKRNHNVVVTTQNIDKAKKLSLLGARVDCLSVSSETPDAESYNLDVFKQTCLIIAITPMIRQGRVDYPDKIKNIIKLAEAGKTKQIIMISSTAVYDGLNGEVDETSSIAPHSTKALIIDKAERKALSFKGDTVVLRLSGLIGPDRHPGKFLKGNRLLSDPTAPTNLIHQQDAVGLLIGLINSPPHTAIYNGSSKTHATKRQYYEKAAQSLGLDAPLFSEEITNGSGKIINSAKIRSFLNYKFIKDDLLTWLARIC